MSLPPFSRAGRPLFLFSSAPYFFSHMLLVSFFGFSRCRFKFLHNEQALFLLPCYCFLVFLAAVLLLLLWIQQYRYDRPYLSKAGMAGLIFWFFSLPCYCLFERSLMFYTFTTLLSI
ncbi:hypothetical protein AAZV13_13G015500 [Glycine max]